MKIGDVVIIEDGKNFYRKENPEGKVKVEFLAWEKKDFSFRGHVIGVSGAGNSGKSARSYYVYEVTEIEDATRKEVVHFT